MDQECKQCGDVFFSPYLPSGKRPWRKLCDGCRAENKRKTARAAGWGRTVKAKCVECGLKFNRSGISEETVCSPCRTGKAREHGILATYNNGCRCDGCRGAGSAHLKARRRAGLIVEPRRTAEYQCVACGSPFVASRSYKNAVKYCSKECRGWQHGDGKRPKGDYKKRAEHFGVAYEKLDRRDIFRRDNWTCGICNEPVDQSLKFPDRMGVSLDHIIPMSKGGGHVEDNVQCSHWICNILKRDSVGEDCQAA